MSEKKELNQEEIEKVSGGGWFSHLWEHIVKTTKDNTNEENENETSK